MKNLFLQKVYASQLQPGDRFKFHRKQTNFCIFLAKDRYFFHYVEYNKTYSTKYYYSKNSLKIHVFKF